MTRRILLSNSMLRLVCLSMVAMLVSNLQESLLDQEVFLVIEAANVYTGIALMKYLDFKTIVPGAKLEVKLGSIFKTLISRMSQQQQRMLIRVASLGGSPQETLKTALEKKLQSESDGGTLAEFVFEKLVPFFPAQDGKVPSSFIYEQEWPADETSFFSYTHYARADKYLVVNALEALVEITTRSDTSICQQCGLQLPRVKGRKSTLEQQIQEVAKQISKCLSKATPNVKKEKEIET